MTALDIEITPIEGIDLETTPPCEASSLTRKPVLNIEIGSWRFHRPFGKDRKIEPCPNPSVVRVRFNCSKCGGRRTKFFCAAHWGVLASMPIICKGCQTDSVSWREI